ncbi:MAG TPA: hypothetical protein VGI11_18570 [Variovorax sp.]
MADRIEARRRHKALAPVSTPPEGNFLDAATEARRAVDLAYKRRVERQKAEAKAERAQVSPWADLRVVIGRNGWRLRT